MKARSLSSFFTRPRSLPSNDVFTRPLRSQPSKNPRPSHELYRRISKIGDFKVSIVPVLDQWVQEGRPLQKYDLRSFVKELRSYRRYSHALEILTWMTEKRSMELSASDHALCLGLIARVHGIEKAENYFNNLPEHLRSFVVYRALLNCYTNANSVEKAEATMQKMKDLGFAVKTLSYNHLLNVYRQTKNYEKLDDLMHEMEEKGVDFDTYSYSIRLSAYADVSDVHGVEKTLTKMESDPKIVMEWQAYSVVASAYAKAGLVDKALLMLKKAEELVPSIRSNSAFNFLISLYAGMEKKDEVKRLWECYKQKNKVFNPGYKFMISSMLKCDDIEAAEEVFKDWESRDLTYDMYIPNLLIGHYCAKGLLEKAEPLISKLVLDGKKGIRRKNLVACVEYLKAKGDTEKAEKLVGLLRTELNMEERLEEEETATVNIPE